MKSYTDISQSKKLAEILALESADMWWNFYSVTTDDTTPQIIHLDTPWVGSFNWDNKSDNIPCWSLAALFDVLPDEISTGEGYQNKYEIDIRRYYGGNNITLYQIAYGNNKGSSGSWHDIISTSEQEKFVDVCYEMIIKLHEQKLL